MGEFRKMTSFTDVQYGIYANIVRGSFLKKGSFCDPEKNWAPKYRLQKMASGLEKKVGV